MKIFLAICILLFSSLISCSQSEKCDNGVDDDGDGKIDCFDSDCDTDAACAPKCGDGALNQPAEQCDGTDFGTTTCADYGFSSGTLSCDTSCMVISTGCYGTCGDGEALGSEECDGADLRGSSCEQSGYYGGTLGCTGMCEFDFSACRDGSFCGDGVLTTNETTQGSVTEECDGGDMGGATCISMGFEGGTLSCTDSCTIDDTACTVGNGLVGSSCVVDEDCNVSESYSECRHQWPDPDVTGEFPGGYCTTYCVPDQGYDPCGAAGGVCYSGPYIAVSGICLRSCSSTSNCRPGYECTTVGGYDKYCVPPLDYP